MQTLVIVQLMFTGNDNYTDLHLLTKYRWYEIIIKIFHIIISHTKFKEGGSGNEEMEKTSIPCKSCICGLLREAT